MKPILLKVEIDGINIFNNNKLSIDFIAATNVNEDDKLSLFHVSKNIYYSPVLAMVGINASGKSTAINFISSAIGLHVNGLSISNTWIAKNTSSLTLFDGNLTFKSIFYFNNKIVQVESVISKFGNSNNSIASGTVFVQSEIVYEKSISTLNKKNVFSFDDSMVLFTRASLKENNINYSNDLSVIKHYFKESTDAMRPIFNASMLSTQPTPSTNIVYKDSIVKYFDPSIEYLVNTELNNQTLYNLKFYHAEEVYTLNSRELASMLSVGTYKGLILFDFAIKALKIGGYLFIDEIENNLNKAIVIDLIKLFYSKKSNPNGAVLLFSTHYSELLDSIKRNDQIYVFNKGADAFRNEATNFSNLISRSDLKKSEAYISGNLLKGTTPSYRSFREVHQYIITSVSKGD